MAFIQNKKWCLIKFIYLLIQYFVVLQKKKNIYLFAMCKTMLGKISIVGYDTIL